MENRLAACFYHLVWNECRLVASKDHTSVPSENKCQPKVILRPLSAYHKTLSQL